MLNTTATLIDSVDWPATRSIVGGSAFVPAAFWELMRAETEDEAAEAYWKLDNRIVVQGRIFESARHLIGPLILALRGNLGFFARRYAVELLVEIALGEPHESEVALGDEGLMEICRREMAGGLWCFYSLLGDSDVKVRVDVLDILEVVEYNKPRLLATLLDAAEHDSDPSVQSHARDIAMRLGG